MYHVRDAAHIGNAHYVACIVLARLHARKNGTELSVRRDVSPLRQFLVVFLPPIVAPRNVWRHPIASSAWVGMGSESKHGSQ
jgi:hypothetical protein